MFNKLSFLLVSLSCLLVLNSTAKNNDDAHFLELKSNMNAVRNKKDRDSTFYYLRELEKYTFENNLLVHQFDTKYLLFDTYVKFKDSRKALQLGLDLFDDFTIKKRFKPYQFWVVVQYLSECMIEIGDLNQAKYYLNSYKNSSSYLRSRAERPDYLLASIYLQLNENDSALNVMKEYLVELDHYKFPFATIGAYNQLGLVYTRVGDFENALLNFKKTVELIDAFDKRHGLKPTVLGNIGECYLEAGNIEKAYRFFELDIEGSLKENSFESYVSANIELAKIELKWHEFGKSETRLLNLLSSDRRTISLEKRKYCYDILSEIYRKTGHLDKLVQSMEMYKACNDSLYGEKNSLLDNFVRYNSKNTVNNIKKEIELKNKVTEKERKFLLEKIELKKVNTRYIVLIFILILILVLFFLRKVLIERKKERIIKSQTSEIAEQKLKIQKDQKAILELKVKQRNQRISNQALELESKKESAIRIIDKVKEVGQMSRPDLMNIEIFIKNELEVKSVRGQIQNFIGDIGEDFIENLKLKHPKLTDKEIKLSVMVLLKLSNKEIGIGQDITAATVKNNRNRLKKKLSLPGQVSLFDYLNEFL